MTGQQPVYMNISFNNIDWERAEAIRTKILETVGPIGMSISYDKPVDSEYQYPDRYPEPHESDAQVKTWDLEDEANKGRWT